VERVIYVDQKPIGANSRSTPASYLGVFDEVRKVFAMSLEAKARGFSPSHFSYNTGKGRCAECGGLGAIKLEMNFLPDAAVTCESCRGRRYRDEIDSVLFQGISIADALRLTFDEARAKFANHRKILGPIRLACDLGLGYLTLGQPSTTLSGGESQRLKLVSELWAQRQGHSVYVLDEPTTGLHKADVEKLLRSLRELIVRGNSVLLIEHDPEVLLSSDFLIELGPTAGGGEIVFGGAPDKLLNTPDSTPWSSIISRYVASGPHSATAFSSATGVSLAE
jgi:excinuclease ABC subunit A